MLLSCLGPVPCSFGWPVPLPSWLADGPAGQVVGFVQRKDGKQDAGLVTVLSSVMCLSCSCLLVCECADPVCGTDEAISRGVQFQHAYPTISSDAHSCAGWVESFL